MSGWSSPWGLTDVIAQAAESASQLKDNLERTMDQALQSDNEEEEAGSKSAPPLRNKEKSTASYDTLLTRSAKPASTSVKTESPNISLGKALDFFADFGVSGSDATSDSAQQNEGAEDGTQQATTTQGTIEAFAKHLGLTSEDTVQADTTVDDATQVDAVVDQEPQGLDTVGESQEGTAQPVEMEQDADVPHEEIVPASEEENLVESTPDEHVSLQVEAEQLDDIVQKDTTETETKAQMAESQEQQTDDDINEAITNTIQQDPLENVENTIPQNTIQANGIEESTIDEAATTDELVEESATAVQTEQQSITEEDAAYGVEEVVTQDNPSRTIDTEVEDTGTTTKESNTISESSVNSDDEVEISGLVQQDSTQLDEVEEDEGSNGEMVDATEDYNSEVSNNAKEEVEHKSMEDESEVHDNTIENNTIVDKPVEQSANEQNTIQDNTIEQLKQLVNSREAQLESSATRCATLTEELHVKSEHYEALQQQYNTLQEQYNTLQDQHKTLQAEQKEFKKQYNKLKKELSTIDELKEKARESEIRAESLMEEGMELAKKTGTLETALRKVRKELSTSEESRNKSVATKEKLTAELETVKSELENLKAVHSRGEKSMMELNTTLNTTSQETKKRIQHLETENKGYAAKISSLKDELAASKETLNDVRREAKATTQQLHSTRSETEQLRHQLREQLSSVEMRNSRAATIERSALDTRNAMLQQQNEWQATETALKAEIKSLRKRVQEADARNEDLVSTTAQTTAPLIRQIDALKNMASMRQDAMQTTQATLMARAVAAEKSEAVAVESARTLTLKCDALVLKKSELEASVVSLKSENARILSQLGIGKERAERSETERRLLLEQLDELREKMDTKARDARGVEAQLRKGLLLEQEKHERQIQKVETQHRKDLNALRDKVAELTQQLQTQKIRKRSTSGAVQSQPQILRDLNVTGESEVNSGETSVSGETDFSPVSLDGNVSTIQYNTLQRALQSKTAELMAFKQQYNSTQQTQHQLSESLVALTGENDTLKSKIGEMDDLKIELKNQKTELKQLQFKHGVLLGLLGEREETIEELNSDLVEVKKSYQDQIDELAKALHTSK